MFTRLSQSGTDALEALYGNMPLAVVLAGPEHELLYANREFFTLTECSLSDLEFMNFQDLCSMFCLSVCEDLNEFLSAPGRWRDIEKPIAMADGNLAWVRMRVDTADLPQGGPCLRLLVDNVTRYKVAIESLLNRKNLYQSIVETRQDLICCFLPDGSLTYANAASARHFRAEPGEIIGENFLLLLDPGARERLSSALALISQDNPMAEVEYKTAAGPDAPPSWMRWIIQGFFYKTGHIKDYQATGMDVTEQKVAESQFMHADRLVSLGTLVSEVAHEISNPNNFIMLNAPLALDLWRAVSPAIEKLVEGGVDRFGGIPAADLARDIPQLLGGVIEGSKRIRDYVRELKNFSRQDFEGGFETLPVNDVVQSAVLLMSKTIGLHTSRFSVRYGSGLPLVKGRRQRLEQIVVNLVQNSCHALTGTHQSIEIETLHHEDTGSVRIVVRDQGVGISREDLPRVTEPFYTTKRHLGGTGLGLSISLSIAREHGGQLLIESIPGAGTTAVVALPTVQREAAQS